MPLRDHFRPPVESRHSWDELHGMWPAVIVQQLFPLLPEGYVAAPGVHLGACVGGHGAFERVGDRCVCRWTISGETQVATVPLPPAAFRTILARIAALCNERSPNSVSHYGGEGLLAVKGNPSTVFHVTFINTPNEQRLELGCKAEDKERVENLTESVPSCDSEHPGPTGDARMTNEQKSDKGTPLV